MSSEYEVNVAVGATNYGFLTHHDTLSSQETAGGQEVTQSDPYSTQSWRRTLLTFTSRQWTFLLIFGLANVFRGTFILIAGPFYPPEAEERGLTNSEIGFVFASYDLATFGVALFFGKFIIPKLGPRLVFNLSVLNLGLCSVLFGCLTLTDSRALFLALSFLIRILAGAGDAGFYPSAFVIFAQEFEGNVATAIGLFEFLFGVGAIGGPIIFGAFKDQAGFLVVYAIVGGLLLLAGVLVHFFTPKEVNKDMNLVDARKMSTVSTLSTVSKNSTKKWYQLLTIPTVLLVILNLFTASASIGFVTGTLEKHLEQFDLPTFQTSAIFSANNAIYTVLTPVWGKVADALSLRQKNGIVIVGSGFIFLGFCALGPLPFLSESVLWSTLLGLGLHGVGIGGAVLSAFPHAVEAALAGGFSECMGTFSLVSSLFTLTFCLGNAVGPSVAGVLVDHVGFQSGTLFICGLTLFVMFCGSLLSLFGGKKRKDSDF